MATLSAAARSACHERHTYQPAAAARRAVAAPIPLPPPVTTQTPRCLGSDTGAVYAAACSLTSAISLFTESLASPKSISVLSW